jgi:hypothetical protein
MPMLNGRSLRAIAAAGLILGATGIRHASAHLRGEGLAARRLALLVFDGGFR